LFKMHYYTPLKMFPITTYTAGTDKKNETIQTLRIPHRTQRSQLELPIHAQVIFLIETFLGNLYALDSKS